MGLLLTLLQIDRVVAAPVAITTTCTTSDVTETDYDFGTSTTSYPAAEESELVLESPDGEVYVPLLTFISSVPYTESGTTGYSTTIITSYSTSTSTTVTSSTTTATSLIAPVLSTRLPDTASYTLPISTALASLTSSAIQSVASSVSAHTSGVRFHP